MNNTVLAHLSGGFSSGSENAATEALAFVLNGSASAREALDDLVRSGVKDVNPIVKVRTQVDLGGGVMPDLVGEDADGERQRVIVEVKFWADLTPNQPVAYLKRLPEDGASALLFLVPDERVRILWPVLRRRATDEADKSRLGKLLEVDAERRCLRVDGTQRHLMVVGWMGLLDVVAARARDAGEHGIESDVRQLRGLAAQVIEPPEPNGDGGLRSIIDSVADQGVQDDLLNTKGLNRQRRKGRYGRYVRFVDSGVTPWFGINDELYKSGGETRLWLRFAPPTPKRGRLDQAQFDALRTQCPVRGTDWSWVPLVLKQDVERSEVLDDVLDQIERISRIINGAT